MQEQNYSSTHFLFLCSVDAPGAVDPAGKIADSLDPGAKSLNAVPDNDGGDDFPSETFWAGCRSMDLQDWVESVKTQPPDKVGLTSLQLPRLKQGLSIFSITIKKAYANL